METSISESSQILITRRFTNDGTTVGHPRISIRSVFRMYARYRRLFGDDNYCIALTCSPWSIGPIWGRRARNASGYPTGSVIGRDSHFQNCVLKFYDAELWPDRYWQAPT